MRLLGWTLEGDPHGHDRRYLLPMSRGPSVTSAQTPFPIPSRLGLHVCSPTFSNTIQFARDALLALRHHAHHAHHLHHQHHRHHFHLTPTPISPSSITYSEQIFLIWGLCIAAVFVVFIQLVAMYVAYWAFTHRKSCDCCYDSNGIPNCPSARPNVSSHCARTDAKGRACSQVLLSLGRRHLARGLWRCMRHQYLFRHLLYIVSPHCLAIPLGTPSESLDCRACWVPMPRWQLLEQTIPAPTVEGRGGTLKRQIETAVAVRTFHPCPGMYFSKTRLRSMVSRAQVRLPRSPSC